MYEVSQEVVVASLFLSLKDPDSLDSRRGPVYQYRLMQMYKTGEPLQIHLCLSRIQVGAHIWSCMHEQYIDHS